MGVPSVSTLTYDSDTPDLGLWATGGFFVDGTVCSRSEVVVNRLPPDYTPSVEGSYKFSIMVIPG